ncbi:Six-hairpin glycosidase [Auricularia subglabra TFB-10046 SS5]|nr:Six-hairpin glycosidase [Auricularia subglabra TFB-10046 SS5]
MGGVLPLTLILLAALQSAAAVGEDVLYNRTLPLAQLVRSAMLGNIRASWEQGVSASALLEFDYPRFSLFGPRPFQQDLSSPMVLPQSVLQLAASAVTRQGTDGRLSQQFGDGNDAGALDGAAAGPAVLLDHSSMRCQLNQPSRIQYWRNAAIAQLNYLLNTAPRTSTGAISHRSDSRQYWADGVFMGFPFIAQYGGIVGQPDLLQIGYRQCQLYHDALIRDGPTGKLWAHIYSDDDKIDYDGGLWATGNAWAALGMLHVAVSIDKSAFAADMRNQRNDLLGWVKEILDGTFAALSPLGLVPNYLSGNESTFSDASASAALAAVAYRVRTLYPDIFGDSYSNTAATIRQNILDRLDPELGIVRPVVDPITWGATGTMSTEAQAFFIMMMTAWRDWIAAQPTDNAVAH